MRLALVETCRTTEDKKGTKMITRASAENELESRDIGYRAGLMSPEDTCYGYSNPWKKSSRIGKAFESGKIEGENARNKYGCEWANKEIARLGGKL